MISSVDNLIIQNFNNFNINVGNTGILGSVIRRAEEKGA